MNDNIVNLKKKVKMQDTIKSGGKLTFRKYAELRLIRGNF